MRKITIFLSIFLIALIASCSKDDDLGNIPPSKVENIDAVSIDRTKVRVSWNPSVDPNNDEISYDVVVNDKIIGSKITETFIEFDAAEFIPSKTFGIEGDKAIKGLTVEFIIKVKAYDTNSSVSEEVEIKKTLVLNISPSEVFDIQAEVVEKTIVKLSWKPSAIPNDDQISYDVVVNDKVIASKTTEHTIEFDTAEFLPSKSDKASENEVTKGASLELIIKIKAFDTNGNVSEEVEAKRSVFVNRFPGVFEFSRIDFDMFYFNSLEIAWTPASDMDGDIVSYNVYLNDILISENVIIGSDSFEGKTRYSENFEQYLNDEVVIKVIADDKSGGTFEISETFNFRTTDTDLGVFALPYEKALDVEIQDTEPDRIVRYSFQIENETGYYISSNPGLGVYLRSADGILIDNGGSTIQGDALSAGSYFLEVYNFNKDVTVTDKVFLTLRDKDATDTDLGVLLLPYEATIDAKIEKVEPDKKVRYSFEVEEEVGYYISSNVGLDLVLRSADGSYINGGQTTLQGEAISKGIYYVEISNYYNNNNDITENISIAIRNVNETDVDLGALTLPYTNTASFVIDNAEVDKKVRYTFEVTEETGYYISSNSGAELVLRDINGNYINGRNGILEGERLSEGSYYLEVGKYYYNDSTISGNISFTLRNSTATDIDLGALSVPYDEAIDFDILQTEVDNKVGYNFEITEETGFYVETQNNAYFTLKNSRGNVVFSGGNSVFGESLAVGTYYLEVSNYYNTANSGVFNLILDDPKSSDVDLGLLSVPYNESTSFTISDKEFDKKIGYTFEISETTGYSFSTNVYANIYLYNVNGIRINSNTNRLYGDSLTPGTYYLEISGSNNANGTIQVLFNNPELSDVDLGIITTDSNQSFVYNMTNEVDNKIRYKFTVNEAVSYVFDIIDEDYSPYLLLYNSAGNLLNNTNGFEMKGALAAGTYYIEVSSAYNNSVGTGTLVFGIQL